MIIEKPLNNKEYRITLDTDMRKHLGLNRGDIYTVDFTEIDGENVLIFKNKVSPKKQEDTKEELSNKSNKINKLKTKDTFKDKIILAERKAPEEVYIEQSKEAEENLPEELEEQADKFTAFLRKTIKEAVDNYQEPEYSKQKCGYCDNEIGKCRLRVNNKIVCEQCKQKLIFKTINDVRRIKNERGEQWQ